ncbi:MAG: glycosyltransferase [Bacteroidota bacterium]|nr:glycosyltransferase [Bacteroidota bacterium]
MIGLFNETFPPLMDGVALTTYNYAYWLHQNGHPVSVVTPFADGERFDEPFQVFRYPSFPLPKRKPYRWGLPYLSTPTVFQIHRTPFKIVHGHSPFSAGRLGMSIAKKREIPFIMSFHSKFREDFTRSVKSPLLVDWMIRHIMEVYEAADEVWISQEAVEEVLRSYGYTGKTEIVGLGNDFASITNVETLRAKKRKELEITPETPLFLFVGQQILEKNIPFLLDSLSLLDFPFRMILVGEGYGLESFREQVVTNGQQEMIFFTGSITDREELASLYAAADLFLFPSLYDTAGLVIREAAALGTPSLLIEGSTAATAIQDNVNGFVSPHDTTAYASRITEIIRNKALLQRVALGAEETLTRSWEDISREVFDRYQHLIARKR